MMKDEQKKKFNVIIPRIIIEIVSLVFYVTKTFLFAKKKSRKSFPHTFRITIVCNNNNKKPKLNFI